MPTLRSGTRTTSGPPVPTLLVYGATSYTGKLLVSYLHDHPEVSSFKFNIAGRNAERLGAVKKDLGLKDEVDVVVCPLVDQEEVDRMVKECSVVINLAGPYSIHNAEMLIRSCASQGKHYVDLTGETPWVRQMVDKYDHLAWLNRSCIVPSCGFDSIPSDSTAYLSAQALSPSPTTHSPTSNQSPSLTATGEEQQGLTADVVSSKSFWSAKAAPSGGTVASAFAVMAFDPVERNLGLGEFALTKCTRGVSSGGTKLFEHDSSLGMTGSLYMMGPVNTAAVRRTWYLLQNYSSRIRALPSKLSHSTNTNPSTRSTRSTRSSSTPSTSEELVSSAPTPGTSIARYGSNFTYSETFMYGRRGTKGGSVFFNCLAGLVVALTGLAFASSRVVRWWVKRVMPSPGEGPSPDTYEKGWLDVTNISRNAAGKEVVSVMSVEGEPAYFVTARMLAESALALTVSHDELPAIGLQGGVLTPMAAMGDVLIERLEATGRISYRTSSVEEWRESVEERKRR